MWYWQHWNKSKSASFNCGQTALIVQGHHFIQWWEKNLLLRRWRPEIRLRLLKPDEMTHCDVRGGCLKETLQRWQIEHWRPPGRCQQRVAHYTKARRKRLQQSVSVFPRRCSILDWRDSPATYQTEVWYPMWKVCFKVALTRQDCQKAD